MLPRLLVIYFYLPEPVTAPVPVCIQGLNGKSMTLNSLYSSGSDGIGIGDARMKARYAAKKARLMLSAMGRAASKQTRPTE